MTPVYIRREGAHFLFQIMLQGKPIVAYYPAWMVNQEPNPTIKPQSGVEVVG